LGIIFYIYHSKDPLFSVLFHIQKSDYKGSLGIFLFEIEHKWASICFPCSHKSSIFIYLHSLYSILESVFSATALWDVQNDSMSQVRIVWKSFFTKKNNVLWSRSVWMLTKSCCMTSSTTSENRSHFVLCWLISAHEILRPFLAAS
jgi:hypothetical protein